MKRFRVPRDTIGQAVRKLDETGQPEHARAIEWLAGYLASRNIGADEADALLQKPNGSFYSWASIYQALTGRRSDQGADMGAFVAAVQAFRIKVEPTSRVGESGFIETRLSKEVFMRCDRARANGRILFIFGESQIGKTESLAEYTRTHNHGQTIMIETPTKPSLHSFKGRLAERLALPQNLKNCDLDQRIFKCFYPGMLLVIDEAHRTMHTERGWMVLDYLREIYNQCGCGIVLTFTPEGRKSFFKGPQAERLKQLWRRRDEPLNLPAILPSDDLDRISAAHGLPAAPAASVTIDITYIDEDGSHAKRKYSRVPADLQSSVVQEEGLGVWISTLSRAVEMAKKEKRTITWGAVLKSHALSQADSTIWS